MMPLGRDRYNFLTPLEIAFDKRSLRQICESDDRAKGELGAKAAEKLKRRLADLRAAPSVKDLVAGRPRELEGSRHPHIGIDLSEGYCLVFCANHNATPRVKSGDVDWSRVCRIKLLRIEKCHA